MKSNYTHITFIIDRSGSMDSIRNDVIGGFNRFLDEQKAVPGECTVTLVQFDTQDAYEILRDHQPISEVQHLGDEYRPRAGTPLYDAIGRGIVNTGAKLASIPEDQRPEKVIFVIMTDGEENSSKEYDNARVKAMTTEHTDKWKWQFVYLGANQDAMAVGATVGVRGSTAMDYAPTSRGIKTASSSLSANAAAYRTGTAPSMDWSQEQRDEAKAKI